MKFTNYILTRTYVDEKTGNVVTAWTYHQRRRTAEAVGKAEVRENPNREWIHLPAVEKA